jgi:hypothetical protein
VLIRLYRWFKRSLCRSGSLVKLIFELLIGAAKTHYNLSGPVDILSIYA